MQNNNTSSPNDIQIKRINNASYQDQLDKKHIYCIQDTEYIVKRFFGKFVIISIVLPVISAFLFSSPLLDWYKEYNRKSEHMIELLIQNKTIDNKHILDMAKLDIDKRKENPEKNDKKSKLYATVVRGVGGSGGVKKKSKKKIYKCR